jgi:hypothetical protein
MTEPTDPLPSALYGRRSGQPRRVGDPARADAGSAPSPRCNLPVVISGSGRSQRAPDDKPSSAEPAGAFAAQVMGQTGQKRGLRGGPQVLDHARSAYLETEWSGVSDRRPPKGVITKTEI